MRRCAILLLASVVLGCTPDPEPSSVPTAPMPSATPVTVARVRHQSLPIIVRGPGRTATLHPVTLRAPFDGLLVSLAVGDGDPVRAGQLLGRLVAQNSQAEVDGARALLQGARTAAQRKEARRALANALSHQVQAPLRAPSAGVVVSHAANQGDLVSRGQELVTLTAAHSVVFVAQVVQTALPSLRPGEHALVQLAARAEPLAARVHGVLPAASSDALQAQVLLDLPPPGLVTTGLFGTAVITVGEHADATVVPESAVLRDDVSGTSRVALVTPEKTAHWVVVHPGLAEGGWVELLSPKLRDGNQVIVGGQVGLPEGTRVEIQR